MTPAQEYLTHARKIAKKIAKRKGEVAADDVQKVLPRPSTLHYNIMTGLFTKEFLLKGYRPSTLPQAKRRIIGVYTLPKKKYKVIKMFCCFGPKKTKESGCMSEPQVKD